MEINMSGRRIILKANDVEIAFKLVNSFLSSVRDSAVSHGKMPMYLTTLVAMYVASANSLKTIDPDLTEIISKMQEDKDND